MKPPMGNRSSVSHLKGFLCPHAQMPVEYHDGKSKDRGFGSERRNAVCHGRKIDLETCPPQTLGAEADFRLPEDIPS